MKSVKQTRQICAYALGALWLAATLPANAIVGGQIAKETTSYDTSWMVFVVDQGVPVSDERSGCGGTLIAPQWVLTTSSCAYDLERTPESQSDTSQHLTSKLRFREGSFDVIFFDDGRLNTPSMRVKVAEIHRPQTHRIIPTGDAAGFDNDPTLLKLERPVSRPTIRVADINTVANKTPFDASILGWGATTVDRTANPSLALRVATLSFESSYPYYSDFANSKSFFASSRRYTPCAADEGGPVVAKHRNSDEWVQVGLISDFSSCEKLYSHPSNKYFTGFSRLRFHLDWIQKTLNEEPTVIALPDLPGTPALNCKGSVCEVDVTNLYRADGTNPYIHAVTVRSLSDPGGWQYALSTGFGATVFSTKPGEQFEIRIPVTTQDTEFSRYPLVNWHSFIVRRDDFHTAQTSRVDPLAIVRCEKFELPDRTCIFDLLRGEEVYFHRWNLNGDSYFTDELYVPRHALKPGVNRVVYSARTHNNVELRQEFLIRNGDDAIRVTEIHRGQLDAGKAHFPFSRSGQYVSEGRIVATLRSQTDGIRLLLQKRPDFDDNWETVRETARIRTSNGMARLSYPVTEFDIYRLVVFSRETNADFRIGVSIRQ